MTNNKQITKNALMLYIRMAVMTAISLYTSRVVLDILGIEDYGVYSLVAGIAVLFSFFSNALYTSTQRFITFEIGKGDAKEIKDVFTTSINCHIVIALLVVLFSECFGLWLLNSNLNIPKGSLYAANIVFQLSLCSCVLGILNAPFTASIIAHEKMSFFAWTSILDAISKLLIVYILSIGSFNKLIFYASLLCVWAIIKIFIERFYCHIYLKNCRYTWSFNKKRFKAMMNFSTWTLFKTGAILGVNQGNNVLINLFGGPIASAAMGITNQVNGTVYTFMQNVQIAFNPQITKKFAIDNIQEFNLLIFRSAKLSSFLLSFLAIPFLLNTEYILNLWLKEVPLYTVNLCRLAILSVFIDSLTGPLGTAVMSEGRIRNYQIISSILWFVAIPCAWLLLYIGSSADCILWGKIIAQVLCLIYTMFYLKKRINFSSILFLKNAIFPSVCIFLLGYILIAFSMSFIHVTAFFHLLFSVMLTFVILFFLIVYVGMIPLERKIAYSFVKKYILKKNEED